MHSSCGHKARPALYVAMVALATAVWALMTWQAFEGMAGEPALRENAVSAATACTFTLWREVVFLNVFFAAGGVMQLRICRALPLF
mmetsp:Transcript_37727/g.82595  ORF Transcript_37727/g.82595 Transcript_37727/m.82595 type:complete len:86 (+) Transcript_37727:82-339(+)